MELEQMGKLAKEASRSLLKLSQPVKNACLVTVARNLVENTDTILEANEKDIENGRKNNMPESLLDRLKLTRERIDGIAEGVRQVAALEDPIGEVLSMKESKRSYDWEKARSTGGNRYDIRIPSKCHGGCVFSLL